MFYIVRVKFCFFYMCSVDSYMKFHKIPKLFAHEQCSREIITIKKPVLYAKKPFCKGFLNHTTTKHGKSYYGSFTIKPIFVSIFSRATARGHTIMVAVTLLVCQSVFPKACDRKEVLLMDKYEILRIVLLCIIDIVIYLLHSRQKK